MKKAAEIAREEQVPRFGNTARGRIWGIIDDAKYHNFTEDAAVAKIRKELIRTRIAQGGPRSLKRTRKGKR